MTQLEVKIVTFNPTGDTEKFASDIYVLTHDNCWNRIYCGTGGKDKYESIKEATNFLDFYASELSSDVDWLEKQTEYWKKLTNGEKDDSWR